MSITSISTSLPLSIISSLERKGAKVLRDCEIPIVVLEMEDSIRCYKDLLLEAKDDIDPLLAVTFGPLLNPYISLAAQVEVWTILATYRPLLAAAFAPGAPAITLAAPVVAVPVGGGFQFHHSQIALHAVMARIENPADPAGLPLLTAMNSGDTICDINITYANCVVTRRIRRL